MPREGQYIPVDFSKRARFAHFSTPTLRNCFWKSISNSSSDFWQQIWPGSGRSRWSHSRCNCGQTKGPHSRDAGGANDELKIMGLIFVKLLLMLFLNIRNKAGHAVQRGVLSTWLLAPRKGTPKNPHYGKWYREVDRPKVYFFGWWQMVVHQMEFGLVRESLKMTFSFYLILLGWNITIHTAKKGWENRISSPSQLLYRISTVFANQR